jgi:hypothetical protein
MAKNIKPISLRANGTALVMSIPVDIMREHNLHPGDQVYWISEPDCIKLKVQRIADVITKLDLPAMSK